MTLQAPSFLNIHKRLPQRSLDSIDILHQNTLVVEIMYAYIKCLQGQKNIDTSLRTKDTLSKIFNANRNFIDRYFGNVTNHALEYLTIGLTQNFVTINKRIKEAIADYVTFFPNTSLQLDEYDIVPYIGGGDSAGAQDLTEKYPNLITFSPYDELIPYNYKDVQTLDIAFVCTHKTKAPVVFFAEVEGNKSEQIYEPSWWKRKANQKERLHSIGIGIGFDPQTCCKVQSIKDLGPRVILSFGKGRQLHNYYIRVLESIHIQAKEGEGHFKKYIEDTTDSPVRTLAFTILQEIWNTPLKQIYENDLLKKYKQDWNEQSTLSSNGAQDYLDRFAYSPSIIADILSTSRRTIERRIEDKSLQINKEGKIPLGQLASISPLIKQCAFYRKRKVLPKQRYTVAEFFTGAGGMAIGLEKAGLKSIFINEINPAACKTLRHNRPKWNVVEEDITKIDFSQYDTLKEGVDVVVGGFPCQPFSYAGKSLGFQDTRGTLFYEFARAVKELSPKVFIAENVKGINNHDSGRTLQTICDVFEELGYSIVCKDVFKAILYRVPQKRERLFIIGVRKDLVGTYKPPVPCPEIYTLRDALCAGPLYKTDVPTSSGQTYPDKKKKFMKQVPEGGFYFPIDVQKEYMKGSFHLGGGIARRLSMDEPSLTLTTSPAQNQTERCHPKETRPLQIREYARIQTFPDEWEFKGSLTAQYKQIGNAVPVHLAYAIGQSVVAFLNACKTKPKD